MDIKFKKIIIKLKAAFILNKQKRKSYRNEQLAKLKLQKRNKAKWGVSYSLFDGEELLEPSLLSIRDSVDYINVVYQKVSWVGQEATENIEELLKNLKEKGLIDEIIEYQINPNIENSFIQETIKRQLGLKHLVKAGCNYYLPMDVDEFYFKDELESAKNYILNNDIEYSFCCQVAYALSPLEVIKNVHGHHCYVAFFSKVDSNSILYGISSKNKRSLPCLVDASRVLNPYDSKIRTYFFSHIKMHHMSYVRNNLKRKFENCSTPDRRNNYTDNISFDTYSVDDAFGIMKYLNAKDKI